MNDILHIDCDAFYASCEELRNPKLKDKAIAVGGLSNKSIITTANYKARQYGIHSAMPVFMARELCPNLILIPVDHKYYRQKSKEVFDIIRPFGEILEQVSIDEAYLKINSNNPLSLAQKIQNEVYNKTKIGVSIGVSYNKFLAKLASDWNKPKGIKEISREDLPEILLDLDISKVHGLGNHGVEKLQKIGIYKISDLMKLDLSYLKNAFGKQGEYIYKVIRGEDNRKVKESRLRKSIGRERTFRANTKNKDVLENYLKQIAEKLEDDMNKNNLMGKTVNLKVKNSNFKIYSKSKTLQEPICKNKDIYHISKELLDEIYKGEEIRLIGISISKLSKKETNQLSFL